MALKRNRKDRKTFEEVFNDLCYELDEIEYEVDNNDELKNAEYEELNERYDELTEVEDMALHIQYMMDMSKIERFRYCFKRYMRTPYWKVRRLFRRLFKTRKNASKLVSKKHEILYEA